MCIDFLPDGRMLVVDSAQPRLLRREPDGSRVTHADLSAVSTKPWNDIVVDDRGNTYVNTIGFDFPGGEFAPGLVVFARQTAMSARSPAASPSTAPGVSGRGAAVYRRWRAGLHDAMEQARR
jgi:sugar lactone lactonase YvrE